MLEEKLVLCPFSLEQKQALQMAAKEWSDNETFLFRNVLWTGLGGNFFLWAKTFPVNK